MGPLLGFSESVTELARIVSSSHTKKRDKIPDLLNKYYLYLTIAADGFS
jgi:hypothetical protein